MLDKMYIHWYTEREAHMLEERLQEKILNTINEMAYIQAYIFKENNLDRADAALDDFFWQTEHFTYFDIHSNSQQERTRNYPWLYPWWDFSQRMA